MKFLKEGSIYATGNIASAAVPFILLPLLTRVLGPDEYGQVVSFAMFVTLCLTTAGLNVHAALGVIWFQRPREEMPAYTGTALGIALVSTLVISPLVALLLWRFPAFGGGLSPFWGAVAGVTAGSTVVLQARLVLWQSQHRPVPNAILQFTNSVMNVGLSLAGVVLLGFGNQGRNGGIALAGLLMAGGAVLLFIADGEVRWAPRKEHFQTFVTFGAPLILHSLAGVMLASTDRWMVSVKLGSQPLGIYGAGAQLGMVMAILADAFVKAYGPWLYSKLSSSRLEDHRCAVGAVYAAMPAFFILALLVGTALTVVSGLLLGPKYRAAASLLPWFMVGGAMNGVYLCTSGLYFFSGRTGLLASTTFSAACLGALTTWVLVARYGVAGAAAGYAATQGLLAVCVTAVALKNFDLPWWEPRRALAAWFGNLRGQMKQNGQ